MAPLRIAVLECDTPLDMTRHKYGGGYGGVFRALLESGAAALAEEEQPGGSHARPVELEVTKYNVELEEHYPDVEDVDAVLITGSRKSHCHWYYVVIYITIVASSVWERGGERKRGRVDGSGGGKGERGRRGKKVLLFVVVCLALCGPGGDMSKADVLMGQASLLAEQVTTRSTTTHGSSNSSTLQNPSSRRTGCG